MIYSATPIDLQITLCICCSIVIVALIVAGAWLFHYSQVLRQQQQDAFCQKKNQQDDAKQKKVADLQSKLLTHLKETNPTEYENLLKTYIQQTCLD